MSLEILSNELIILVIEHIQDAKGLACFASCSRRFYHLVVPHLYQSFKQTGTNAIPALLRTILSDKSGLALYLRHFDVTYIPPNPERKFDEEFDDCDYTSLDLSSFTDENMSQARQAIRRASKTIYGWSKWSSHMIDDGQWGAVTALLIYLLPNLETIRIVGFGLNDPWMSTVFCREDTTTNLNSLSLISKPPEDYCSDISNCLNYLTSRSLTKFHAHKILDNSFVRPESQSFPHIREISLTSSSLSPGAIKDFLLCFPSLIKIQCEFTDEVRSVFLPCTFIDAIAHLKLHLEELEIVSELEEDFDEEEFDENFRGPLGTLEDFAKIRKLEASAWILLWEVSGEFRVGDFGERIYRRYEEDSMERFVKELPPFLESLTIRDCPLAIFDVISRLVTSDDTKSLKSIDLVFLKLNFALSARAELLVMEAAERGISVTIRKGRSSPYNDLGAINEDMSQLSFFQDLRRSVLRNGMGH